MSGTRFDLSPPPSIGSYLVGLFNRFKNYTRWSWEWYKLNPYRNTLISVLLFIIFFRGGHGPSVEVTTAVPVASPPSKKQQPEQIIVKDDAINPKSPDEAENEWNALVESYERLNSSLRDMSKGELEAQAKLVTKRLHLLMAYLRSKGFGADFGSDNVNANMRPALATYGSELRFLAELSQSLLLELKAKQEQKLALETELFVVLLNLKKHDRFKTWKASKVHDAPFFSSLAEKLRKQFNQTINVIPLEQRNEQRLQAFLELE